MTDHYILRGKIPFSVGVEEWAKWFENSDRSVVQTHVEGDKEFILVSTVFLGLDHSFSGGGPPVIFETMVFGGDLDQEMERYSTWDEAETGHLQMIKRVEETL